MEMVNWPSLDEWSDSGEGGMFVYAVIVEANRRDNCIVDAWVELHADAPVSNVPRDMRSIVLLSTTEHSFVDSEGSHFEVTRGDLTEDGLRFIAMLEEITGPVRLVTCLDT